MNKKQLINRHARNLKSLVGTGLAQDECQDIIKYAVNEALTLYGVGSSLPSKEETDFEANRQADFINIFGEKRQNLSRYQGFMNCVNWYAEKMKK